MTWFARFVDPDSGREVDTNLTKVGLTTHEARREWAIRKSKALAKRRAEIEAGGARATDKTLADARADYFKTAGARLRERTIELYEEAVDTFIGWCAGNRVELVAEVLPSTVVAFREAL
ncbi:MAG: hypothetical protein KIT58_14725, partial [Planctomycetota bacterium]|nr:hypothetical protein [Planctomycetota bacterium]